MNMIFKYFSLIGYISVLLGLCVPLLWALHAVRRPRGWFCHYAVVVALVALLGAKINSVSYVNRIQIDRSEEIAAAQAAQEARRKAAEDSRAGDVAQVRFAEDDGSDFLDTGGMDDADRKYMTSFDESAEPDWKQGKKSRAQTGGSDDSLEGMLDTTEKDESIETEVVEGKASEPIMMPERHMMAANRLDGLNLKLIRLMILIGLGLVVADYLKRFNVYDESYFPLPLPSKWAEGVTPLPTLRSWPERPRRTMPEELDWLTRRGDSFLYLAESPDAIAPLPEQSWRVRRPQLGKVDLIRVTDENPIAADFIFETLWYGRGSFVVGSAAQAYRLLPRLLELLEARKDSRAHAQQTVHVVWDLDTPPGAEMLAEFERLGGRTGFAMVRRSQA